MTLNVAATENARMQGAIASRPRPSNSGEGAVAEMPSSLIPYAKPKQQSYWWCGREVVSHCPDSFTFWAVLLDRRMDSENAYWL